MVLYFSATGNSAYAAKRIGRAINDQVVSLFEKLRSRDFSELEDSRPWVIVTPTYAWRIPRIVQEWLENTSLIGSRKVYFVMTCGKNIGNAGSYLQKLCAAKSLQYCGCMAIRMPENYIALFSTPAQEEALEIIKQAEPLIDGAAQRIKNGEALMQPPVTLQDKVISGMVNDVFYPMIVHAKKFYAEDTCSSCGKCVKVCPLNNLRLEQGKPVWGKNCTHCMACISLCPTEAIEYGNRSKGKPRYVCRKTMDE